MPLIATRGAASAQGFGEFAQSAAVNYIEDVFSTYLYTGNGSTQTITNNIDLSTKGGLVWLKGRSLGYNNGLFDTVRGADYLLSSNNADPNTSVSGIPANAWITGFNANGFGLGSNGSANSNTQTYVSWTFREQPKFFDIVTYSGDSVDNRQIAHDLGSTPGCVIVRRLSGDDWFVYHRSLAANYGLRLNKTDAESSNTSTVKSVSSTTFTVGTDGMVNVSGSNYIAYLFAHNAGGFGLAGDQNVITCGSYTGNGSDTNGPVINLGYEPQWVLIKNASAVQNWYLLDNMRGMPVGDADANLIPNLSNAESDSTVLSPTATGFQLDTAGSPNNNGNTFIYIAIRRGPMKTPTSGTSVFYPKVHSGSSSYSVGFPTDACFAADQSGNALNTVVVYRLAGDNKYFGGTASTAAEQTVSVCQFDLQNSFQLSYNNNNQARWHFRRAPGFFDVVCYTGTGSATTVSHNLGVVPELMILKARSTSGAWTIYHSALGATKYLEFNTSAENTGTNRWNDTAPTSSVFTIGTTGTINTAGQTYVAYLFATVAGVSKVGSYTGTGSTQTINCGFTAGSQFVLIKRTDSTGDWYVWDSARGIVAGNDPYLLLNSTAAEVTNTDYVDTASTGFEISSTAPAAINANGGTFIFLAIA
jgi:hypothetical protein